MIEDPKRKTCVFQQNETSNFSVEELVAYQLSHAKSQAEKYGNDPVNGAVITVRN